MNIIAVNGVCMLTSGGDEDIVFCEARLKVRFCIAFNRDHVRVRKCLEDSRSVFLRRHDGRTDIAYRNDSPML